MNQTITGDTTMNAYNFTARFSDNTEIVSANLKDCIKAAKQWAKEQYHYNETFKILDKSNTCIQTIEFCPIKFSNGRYFKNIF